MVLDPSIKIVGRRYTLQQLLGKGGTGAVYRATDRLTGKTVALKQVVAPSGTAQSALGAEGVDFRLMLSNEFRLLASLRHPNIITVQDYGFDPALQPYFTMDLLDGAQTILAAGQTASPEAKIQLLVELLQALAYLHRRGILHRDLKPGNILVSRDKTLKLLDFGLSLARHAASEMQEMAIGTPAYMAPELLLEKPPVIGTDLWAVGVIACELLGGHRPFAAKDVETLFNDVLTKQADLSGMSDALGGVVKRLLAKKPENRYESADEAIRALCDSAGVPVPEETAAVRESFLQAARFVGRETELERLKNALQEAIAGKGSAWLVSGESGVGKSRLVDELRVQALVRGAWVLSGQGVAEGALPYQYWREPLRRLALYTGLDNAEASILKQIIPDIGRLLRREVADAAPLSEQEGLQRLLNTIRAQFQKPGQSQPVALLLEDLQWGTESRDVLRRLLGMLHELPLLIVGTYREDERPDLPKELPEMTVIALKRMAEADIAELSKSMLGEAGANPQVVDFLQRETEGNVFFLVEVVRALAEEAGRLSEIAAMTLPQHVVAGGVRQVVQRRLSRVPPEAHPLLNAAAVAGRRLDLPLLGALAGAMNVEQWLTACSNAAVLDTSEGDWRFAHDKLREGVLDTLPVEERRSLNRQVAEALESVYSGREEYAARVSEHYEQAGELARAAEWHIRAGLYAQRTYAPAAAIIHYQKALALRGQSVLSEAETSQTIDVYQRLGKMLHFQARFPEAIEAFTRMREWVGTGGKPASLSQSWYGAAEAQLRLGNVKPALESATQAEAVARTGEARRELAMALWLQGWIQFRMGNPDAALKLGEEVVAICRAIDEKGQMAHGLNIIGAAYYALGRYDKTAIYFEQALAMFKELDERFAATPLMNNLGVLAAARGDYQGAFNRFQEALDAARQIGDRNSELVYLCNLGGARVSLGNYVEAEAELRRFIQMASGTGLGELSEAYSYLARACLGQNKVPEALDAARQALKLGQEMGSQEYIAAAWRVLGQVAAGRPAPITPVDGDEKTYDAAACFAESLRICRETGMEGDEARTLRAWAEYALAHGDTARGTEMWEQAKTIFARSGADLEVERMAQIPASGGQH